MTFLKALILVTVSLTAAAATPSSDDVFSYRVSGRVLFKKHQSLGATVYVMGTRPINGRIPWAHAAKDGTFSIEFSDASDDFRVCAHPGETRGFLPLATTPEEAKKMPIKLSCTEDFRLDEKHTEKRVQLKLK